MKILVFVMFSLVSFLTCAQNKDCLQSIKTGKFYFQSGDKQVQVKRTKRRQVEIYNNGKSKLINKIKWISDNEYIVTLHKSKNANGCVKIGEVMLVTILDCNESYYFAKITSENCGSAEAKVMCGNISEKG